MNLKFLFPLIGTAAGIYVSAEWMSGLSLAAFCLPCALLIWIIITLLSKDPVKGMQLNRFHAAWICLLFISIGSINYYFLYQPYLNLRTPLSLEKPVNMSGVIKDVKTSSTGDIFKVKLKDLKNDECQPIDFRNLNILVKTDGFSANPGDVIQFRTSLTPIDQKNFSDDYVTRLKHQGVEYYVNVRSDKIKLAGEVSGLQHFFDELRDRLIILIEKSRLNKDTGSFIISVLLGDKSSLSSETRQTLNSAGMAHVLALSGMHVGIIVTIILVCLFPLSLAGWHNSRKIIAIVLIWAFVLLTGFNPSTVRAAIMTTLVLIAFLLERRNSALNSLLFAALIILLFDPFSLWNIGFQLSFLCVAAILLFTNRLNPIDHHKHPKAYKIINLILISMIAALTTWVVSAYYFKSVPLLFLPANLLLVPFLPVFILVAIIYLILLLMGIDYGPIAKFLDGFHDLFLGTADFLSLSGYSNLEISLQAMSVVIWLASVLFLSFALYAKKKQNRIIWSGVCLLSFLSFLVISATFSPGNNERIKFMHSFTKLEAQYIKDEVTTRLEFPRQSVSHTQHPKFSVVSIDQKINRDSISFFNHREEAENRFLIVGPGSDNEQIAEMITNQNFKKVILHSGFGKNKKAELLRLVDESKWNDIYSLGDNGSLEFSL